MFNQIKELGIPVRAVPNVCYDSYFPHENGIYGQWIRPEDVDAYENYIEIFEFEDADLEKERALYRIYHDEKCWHDDLNLLFTNFNYSVLNPPLSSDIVVRRRLRCEQNCQSDGMCHLCEIYFNPELLKKKYSSH